MWNTITVCNKMAKTSVLFRLRPSRSITAILLPMINFPTSLRRIRLFNKLASPNFLGARIPIASQLKPQRWQYHLAQFWDKQLPDLIEYGFPLDFCRDGILHPSDTNHMSALQNTSHVEQYISEELSYGAIHGPYHEKPFPMHVSPLMVRD